jgi:iron complex outermembrane recepter protein
MNSIARSKVCGFALSPLMLSFSMAQTPTPISVTQTSIQTSAQNALQPVIVTGNPFRDSDLAQPAVLVSEQELRRRAAGSLGETLNGLPGISSSYFGPNASRPNIRGQEGDRIKVLNNSGASFDVSALSFDHAVPVNPLALERVEILRGPASLLYGGNAIGGVVNLIDRRLPRFEKQTTDGLKMQADVGASSADRLLSAAGAIDVQQRGLAWHVDISQQKRREMKVPITLSCERDGIAVEARQICNSQAKSSDLGFGGSFKLDGGYVGASFSQYKTNYGSPAEAEVTIDMRSQRLMVEGLHRFNQALGLQSIQWQLGRGNYQHQEFEGPDVGTTFKSRGTDSRLELRYRALAESQGVIGFQTEHTNFEAIGEEAFLPPSKTRSVGAFVIQDWSQPWGRLSAGLRIDKVKVESIAGEGLSAGQSTRQFSPINISLGGVFKLGSQWQATSNLSAGQRAPKDYELFADGPHIATSAYEIGDPTLKTEKYRSIDLGLRFKHESNTIKASIFSTRFKNYIGLLAQAGFEQDELPVYAYIAIPARFTGFELEWESRLNSQWQLKARADRTLATNLTTNEALPRIAPARFGASLAWQPSADWQFDLGVDRSAAQNRVPEGELVTKGSTLINAAASWSKRFGQTEISALVKVDNLANRLAYSASSILSQTAPGRVPLPGRNLQLNLKAVF